MISCRMRSANSPAESAIRSAVFVRPAQTRSRAPDLAPVRPAKARYNPIRMISLRMPLQLSAVKSHPCKIIGGYGVDCPYSGEVPKWHWLYERRPLRFPNGCQTPQNLHSSRTRRTRAASHLKPARHRASACTRTKPKPRPPPLTVCPSREQPSYEPIGVCTAGPGT